MGVIEQFIIVEVHDKMLGDSEEITKRDIRKNPGIINAHDGKLLSPQRWRDGGRRVVRSGLA